MGSTTPPRLLPVAAIPFARDRLVEKYCGNIATEGMKMQPFPGPMISYSPTLRGE